MIIPAWADPTGFKKFLKATEALGQECNDELVAIAKEKLAAGAISPSKLVPPSSVEPRCARGCNVFRHLIECTC